MYGAETYKMGLVHLVLSESKKVLTEQWGRVTGTQEAGLPTLTSPLITILRFRKRTFLFLGNTVKYLEIKGHHYVSNLLPNGSE